MRYVLFEENVPVRATSGGHLATLGLVHFLRSRGELHVVNLVSDSAFANSGNVFSGPDVTVISRDESKVSGKLRKLLSPQPKMVAEMNWEAIRSQALPLLRGADRVVFGSVASLNLLRDPEVAAMDTHYIADNVEHELLRSMPAAYRSPWLAKLDAAKLMRFESWGVARVGTAAAFTERDAKALQSLAGGKTVEVIPPVMPPIAVRRQTRKHFALYTTNLGHPPNRDGLEWLLKEVWPLVGAPLVVTGHGDFSEYARLAPEVDFRGLVSREELADLYATAAVAVNPTRVGSGFQIKLLEAISYGCPVVSTAFSNPLGAEIPSSNDPSEFAAHVLRIMDSGGQSFDFAEFQFESCRRLERSLRLEPLPDRAVVEMA